MWKAQSNVMRYTDLRAPPPGTHHAGSGDVKAGVVEGGRLKGIEKDKILRQSPFDACGMILSGNRSDFNERYNSFFIDYSLLPLLVQQNYIDSSQSGIFRIPGKDAADKLDMLSKAADSVSEMELLGAQVRGNDQHWELLPAQAALSMRVGSIVQGYQNFPTFPQWLGKNSTTSKNKRLTQELVIHTLLRARQGFESIRMEYNCYLKFILMKILKVYGTTDMPAEVDGSVCSGVTAVISVLDSYGLSRDDLMDTMQQLQFVVNKDPALQDHFAFLVSMCGSESDGHSYTYMHSPHYQFNTFHVTPNYFIYL
jgi:replication factor C subunit 1